MKRTPRDPVSNYAKGVAAGVIVAGPPVRNACKRHLDDLKNGHKRGLKWDLAAAHHALDFFPDVLTVEVDSEIVPFELLDWQAFVVGSLFGWKRKNGYRRFERAYIESGKGSGKTPLLAGIGLYMMLADKELSAEVYAAAAKRDQAMTMFNDVVKMVDRSPLLKYRLVKSGKNPVWQLTHRPTTSIFKPLSSDKSKSGARVSCALVDELHEHKDRYTIDMLKAGFKGRKQPLMMVATNAGFDRETVCWEWHEHSCAAVEGLREDDQLFAFVMALDTDDDPLEDEACWIKTNPGIDITVTRDYLRGQVNEARQIPGRENHVLRLNFCVWTDSDKSWITRNTWAAIEQKVVDFTPASKGTALIGEFDLTDCECYLGLDLSFSFDLTALAFAFPFVIEDREMIAAWVEYWRPSETAIEGERNDRVPYPMWLQQGLIHGSPGQRVRIEHVGARIAEALDQYDVRWAAFDRYRHKDLEDELDEIGVNAPWIEHPQGFRRGGKLDIIGLDGKPLDNPLWMPDSVEKLETRIRERTLIVQPSPVTRWQVSSVVIRDDPAGTGNRVFNKRKATGRIDGIVALAMAIGAAEMRLQTRNLDGFLNSPVRTK